MPSNAIQGFLLQELLQNIFGETAPKTDYEQKPSVLVLVYSADGSQIAQTCADSIEQVQDKIRTTPQLIGCKAVCYTPAVEISTAISILTTSLFPAGKNSKSKKQIKDEIEKVTMLSEEA